MRTENRSNKIFIIVIALLLIANIVTLTLLLGNNKYDHDDRRNSMRNYLKNEIGFSVAQLNFFDSVKARQRLEVKPMFDEMRTGKQLNLKSIGVENFSDSSIANATEYAATQQKMLEIKMLNHLKEIRDLCTPQQRALFDAGFYKVMSRPNNDSPKKEK